MRNLRRIAGFVTALFLIPLALLGGVLLFAQIAPGRALIVWAVETLVSNDDAQLRIGGLSGRIPFDITVNDVSMADADGVWLDVDRARLVWRPFALAAGVLSIQMVDVDKVSLDRLPQTAESDAEPGGIPVLPFEVRLDRLSIADISLGEPILGAPAAITVTGAARLGDPAEGLSAELDVERIDGTAGQVSARLGYRPDSQELDLVISADEPAGGLVSRLSGLAGVPQLHLDLSGSGPIDDWSAQLALAAGDQGSATGTATISRRSGPAGPTGRALAVDVTADIAGLLQSKYAPLGEGRSTLAARVFLADDGVIIIDSAEILTAAGWVSTAGSFDMGSQALDLRYEVVAGEARRFAGLIPVEAAWRGIELSGNIGGSISKPEISADLYGEALGVAGNAAQSLDLSLTARALGPIDDPNSKIAVTANGRADGLQLEDASFASAAGESAVLKVVGEATGAGHFEAETLQLTLGPGAIGWTGLVDPQGLDGELAARSIDLSTLAGLSGLDLRGIANVTAKLAGRFDGSVLSVSVDAGAEGFASGIPQLDGLLGPRFAITGGAERSSDGSFAFHDLVVAGAALEIVADGSADTSKADVTARIDLPDLASVDDRVTGAAKVIAHLTGSLEDLALQATATVDEATAMGRPIAGLKLEVDAKDIVDTPSGALSLAGTVDGRAVTGSGRVSATDRGGIDIKKLDLVVGSVSVAGDLSVDSDARGTGQVVIKAGDLSDISSLALTEMKGSLDATLYLSIDAGAQIVRATATARDVSAYDSRIGAADLNATVRDPTGRLVVDADLTVRDVDVAGQRIDALELTAQGGASENTFTLSASGLGASINATGGVALVDTDATIRLATLTLSGGGQTGTLTRPATLKIAGGGVSIEGFNLQTGGGGIDADGTVGETLDLRVAIRSLPLSLAEIAMPGSGIAGTLSGNIAVTGSAAAPQGEYSLQVASLLLPAMRQAGIDSAEISASGRLADGRATIDARITSGANATFNVTGSAPVTGAGGLDITTRGRFDLVLLDDMLAASGDRVAGPVDVDMRITGSMDAPDAAGTIRLAGGSYVSPLNGVSFSDIALDARGGLNSIEITRFSARAPNGGTITGSGSVELDTAAGLPINVDIKADNAEVISNDLVNTTIDAALKLTGPVATDPDLTGTVTIRQMDIMLPDRLPSSVSPIPVEHVNTPPAVKAQLSEERAVASNRESGYVIDLDLKVTTTNRIFVRGLGVDAQLGGDITIRGTSDLPRIEGGFQLRRGTVNVIGQRIDFTRGVVTFTGSDKIDPELDLVAETTTSSVTAIVTVSGTAASPVFAFTSSPELPQDEVLARLLFDKATGELTPGEAIQLAQAAAQYAGLLGSGGGMIENIRRKLGLDVLQITTAGDDPAIGIGRYINDNIYVGVTQGVKAESSRVTVDIDITDNISARGAVGADGSSSVGINFEWDY